MRPHKRVKEEAVSHSCAASDAKAPVPEAVLALETLPIAILLVT